MANYKIVLIDTVPDITLIRESLTSCTLPVSIQYVTSVEEAIIIINITQPDLLMVGSSFVLKEGCELISNLGSFPIVVLCESVDLSRILKYCPSSLRFFTRPLEVDEIPEMVLNAYEFMLSCKEC